MQTNTSPHGGQGICHFKSYVRVVIDYWTYVDDFFYRLASFGGAGGQHACEIASLLGIKTILVHRYSSILSAYGLALADR